MLTDLVIIAYLCVVDSGDESKEGDDVNCNGDATVTETNESSQGASRN